MSTILDALLKASHETNQSRGPYCILQAESPYDRRTVSLEQRLMKASRHYRWFAVGFAALAVALVVALVCLATFPGGPFPGREKPAALLAVSDPSPDVQPTPPPPTVVQEPPKATPAPEEPSEAVVIPVNYAAMTENQPHPFSVEPSSAAVVVASTPKEDPPFVIPTETPVPMRENPPAKPVVKPAPKPTTAKKAPSKPSKPMVSKPKTETYTLQGILWDLTDPMAMVNHRSVHEGDRLGEATVVLINRRSVTLDVAGKQVILEIP